MKEALNLTEQTIPQIQTEHSQNAGRILGEYENALDEIKEERHPTDGAYLDRLTDEQKQSLLYEQKHERAKELHDEAVESYTGAVEAYHEKLAKRREQIKERLFQVQDAGALSRAALASDAELETLLDLASHASNKELGRAAFVVAESRGKGDLMAKFFDEVDPEGRQLYGEWSQLPDEEVLERQIENIEQVVRLPDYDRLTPRASAMGR